MSLYLHDRLAVAMVEAVLLFLPFLSVFQSTGQIPTPSVKVQVNLVLVDAQVTEKGTGKIIAGLEKSDFLVTDTGQNRNLAVFEGQALPLDVFVLIDTSSGPGGYLSDVYEHLPMMVQGLRPGDRIGVISFDSDIRLERELTDDRSIALSAIHRALYRTGIHHTVGGTDVGQRIYAANIHGALNAASHLFSERRSRSRRRAIFILTHNRGAFSRSSLPTVITTLLEADVTVEGLVVQQEAESLPGIRGGILIPGKHVIWKHKPEKRKMRDAQTIDPIAEATGGEVLRYSPEAPEWWQAAVERLRARYLLGFYAGPVQAQKSEFHQIKVELTEKAKAKYPDAIVRAPRGYYLD